MGKNVRPCEHRYPLGDPRGARCWRNTSDPSGYCHQHREGLATRRAALAAARDEVIAAARGWAGSVDSAERRLYEMELARAVAALDKLEGR